MNWLLLDSGPCPPAFNMALDEALLEAMPRLGRPVLRFYGWTEPAATFGYFQKYAQVERATRLRPLIRRPTGGGLVPHDADWTYSLVFPPNHEWHSLKAGVSYRRVHEWIQRAFVKLEIETELAPCRDKLEIGNRKSEIPGACFAGHERFDLLWRGRKIAGAAQRRNQLGLLIQGSVQLPPAAFLRNPTMVGTSRFVPTSDVGMHVPARETAGGTIASPNAARTAQPVLRSRATAEGGRAVPTRSDWEKAMCDAGRVEFGIAWSDFAPDETLRARAELLAAQKYAQPAHNRKR